MPVPGDLQAWWQCVPALPAGTHDQAYHALRRVWGDHTIAGARSFYRWGSEDNITPALFQNWAIFSDPKAVAPLIRAAGGSVGSIKKVQWAYACEEILDARLQPFHGRKFIIPDIMLLFEDERGLGLVAFEVKRPGGVAEESDGRKLKSYCDLPSTRRIERRYGCLLVSAKVATKSRERCGSAWPVLSWEDLARLQVSAARETLGGPMADTISQWIARSFARYGIGDASSPAAIGDGHGSEDSYRQINLLPASDAIRRFLKGSEYVEACWHGSRIAPPLAWLSSEPTVNDVRARKLQTTQDRLVCRWHFDWSPTRERSWK